MLHEERLPELGKPRVHVNLDKFVVVQKTSCLRHDFDDVIVYLKTFRKVLEDASVAGNSIKRH